MDDTSISAELAQAASYGSRELDRTCEQVATTLFEKGTEPPFEVRSADFASDPYLICADRYWRLRCLRQPTIDTAAQCARWLVGHVTAEQRAEIEQKWSLGYAFITRDSVESRIEIAEATECIVRQDGAAGDVAFFATLYHGGKLRSNFWFDELHQFLESSLLAMAAGEHRRDPLFVALQTFASFGSRAIWAAGQQHRWERQENANTELQQTMQSSAIRTVELVAIFTAAIAFAVGALQITVNGALALRDRIWLLVVLGAGLAVFALLIIGSTWLITRTPRRK